MAEGIGTNKTNPTDDIKGTDETDQTKETDDADGRNDTNEKYVTGAPPSMSRPPPTSHQSAARPEPTVLSGPVGDAAVKR